MKPKDIIVVKANRTYRIDGRKVKEIKLLEIGVKRTNGEWRAYFRIGVQTFYLSSVPTKSEALWYAKNLRAAFSNLKNKLKS